MINNKRYFYVMNFKFPQTAEELSALEEDTFETDDRLVEITNALMDAYELLDELAQEEQVSVDEARKRLADAKKVEKMIAPFESIYMSAGNAVSENDELAPKSRNKLIQFIQAMAQAIIDNPDLAIKKPYEAAPQVLIKLQLKGLGEGLKHKTLGRYLAYAKKLPD